MDEFQDEAVLLPIQGQSLYLHPSKAIFWKERSRLILADVHLGKAGHFRKAGIPVPQAVAEETLGVLQELLVSCQPQELWVLGDLFHSRKNLEWSLWNSFVEKQAQVKFVLIPGNHDRFISYEEEAPYEIFGEEYVDSPFIFSHEPLEMPRTGVNISGHIHPAVVLKGKGRQTLRLPCFWLRETQLVLPAFGSFTGMANIQPGPQDEVFAICDGKVLPLHA